MILALVIVIGAFALNIFLPWWSIALPGLIFGYLFKQQAVPSFLWGFFGVFLLWGGQALYVHIVNEGILSTRIAEMLGVGSPLIIVLITGVLGGLVSGLATVTGNLASKKKRTFI